MFWECARPQVVSFSDVLFLGFVAGPDQLPSILFQGPWTLSLSLYNAAVPQGPLYTNIIKSNTI